MRKLILSSLLLCAALSFTGCPKPDQPPGTGGTSGTGGTAGTGGTGGTTGAGELVAVTTLEARSGSAISGSATFTQVGNEVRVVVEVKGATPGEHGLHVHEVGDCSAPDAKSAGNHFNPGNQAHGSPTADPHHGGDFGNITVGPDGSARLELNLAGLTVASGASSVVGRSLVLHEKPDDLRTQPSGNSGNRIGCGVIQLKQ